MTGAIPTEMPDHHPLDALALRAARGDAAAFTEIVERLAPEIRNFVATRASSAHMVDEVVQSAFVTAFTRLSAYRPAGNLGGWIKGIARNHLLEELRRQRRSVGVGDLAEQLVADDCLANFEQVEQIEQQAHDAARLRTCLERLPERTRRLIERRYWHDEALADLAKRTRQPANRLSALLYRARQALLGCLASQA